MSTARRRLRKQAKAIERHVARAIAYWSPEAANRLCKAKRRAGK